MPEEQISETQSAVTDPGAEKTREAKDKSEREQLVERWKKRGIEPGKDYEGWTADRISQTLKNLDELDEAEEKHKAEVDKAQKKGDPLFGEKEAQKQAEEAAKGAGVAGGVPGIPPAPGAIPPGSSEDEEASRMAGQGGSTGLIDQAETEGEEDWSEDQHQASQQP